MYEKYSYSESEEIGAETELSLASDSFSFLF